jgi:hypothetical protein
MPDFSTAYYSRALIYIRRKQFPEARAELDAYVQHGGKQDISQLNLPAQ